jgi:hypothetical protein
MMLTPAIKQARHSGWLTQTNFGTIGNFDLVVPLSRSGLGYYWCSNDDELRPWSGPYSVLKGHIDGASLIQSDYYGTAGRGWMEVALTMGTNLMHCTRGDDEGFQWREMTKVGTGVRGRPAFIQTTYGGVNGERHIIVPAADRGLFHYWDHWDIDTSVSWLGPLRFAEGLGFVDDVAFCQSTFGTPGIGNFELVARVKDQLFFLSYSDAYGTWTRPKKIADGVAGQPSILQSRFGKLGHFEVVCPRISDGFFYLWRNNDTAAGTWSDPMYIDISGEFDFGQLDQISLIQSTFNDVQIGRLECAVRAGRRIAMLSRSDGPPFAWEPGAELHPIAAPGPWPPVKYGSAATALYREPRPMTSIFPERASRRS